MSRSLDSSRWYIPLVASTEITRRSGDLTTLPPGNIIGTLPAPLVTPMDSAILWLDSAIVSYTFTDSDGRVYRVNNRNSSTYATQAVPELRPDLDPGPGFDFRD